MFGRSREKENPILGGGGRSRVRERERKSQSQSAHQLLHMAATSKSQHHLARVQIKCQE